MTEVINVRCYDLKKEQVLVCEHCGFELTIVNECNTTCEGEGCCETNEFKCCGKDMRMDRLS